MTMLVTILSFPVARPFSKRDCMATESFSLSDPSSLATIPLPSFGSLLLSYASQCENTSSCCCLCHLSQALIFLGFGHRNTEIGFSFSLIPVSSQMSLLPSLPTHVSFYKISALRRLFCTALCLFVPRWRDFSLDCQNFISEDGQFHQSHGPLYSP